MKIGLKVIAASEQTFTWSHEGPDVHIGRDPECELDLGGDENQMVSWRHALIELRPSGAFVSDCGTTNGTFLNGRRIETRVMLNLGDVVRLGHAGPQMKITAIEPVGGQMEDAELPYASVLVAQEAQPFSTTRMMVAMAQRHQKKAMLWGGTVLAIAFVVVFFLQWSHGRQVSSVSEKTVALAKETNKLGETVVQTRSEMDKKTSDMKRTISANAAEASDASRKAAAAEESARAAREQAVQIRSDVTAKISEVTTGDAENIFKQYGDAVYLVRWQDPGGQSEGRASAFVIGSSGVFATNAHVAKRVKAALDQGLTAELISQGEQRRYPITGAKWHPSYHAGAYDVGALTANVPDGDSLPVMVPLASDQELRELGPGSSLCYIGFPTFNDTDYSGGVVARIYQGRVNRLFSDQYLVEHDMTCWSGASGSPVFNKHGKAVAIIAIAGKKDISLGGETESLPYGSNYAMRIDLLEEVLRDR